MGYRTRKVGSQNLTLGRDTDDKKQGEASSNISEKNFHTLSVELVYCKKQIEHCEDN